MTEHPLTDEICLEITNRPYMIDTRKDDMCTAADWQLEQVIEWLRKNLDERYVYIEFDDGDLLAPGIDVQSVVIDLKQAMRPTTTQENS